MSGTSRSAREAPAIRLAAQYRQDFLLAGEQGLEPADDPRLQARRLLEALHLVLQQALPAGSVPTLKQAVTPARVSRLTKFLGRPGRSPERIADELAAILGVRFDKPAPLKLPVTLKPLMDGAVNRVFSTAAGSVKRLAAETLFAMQQAITDRGAAAALEAVARPGPGALQRIEAVLQAFSTRAADELTREWVYRPRPELAMRAAEEIVLILGLEWSTDVEPSETVDAQTAEPYSPRTRYAVGDQLLHPTFGPGLVVEVSPSKAVIRFRDSQRTLVHAKG